MNSGETFQSLAWKKEEVGWILALMLLKEVLSNVAEFHTAFRIPNADVPMPPSPARKQLRHRLMAEENDEYLEAAGTETWSRWQMPWAISCTSWREP